MSSSGKSGSFTLLSLSIINLEEKGVTCEDELLRSLGVEVFNGRFPLRSGLNSTSRLRLARTHRRKCDFNNSANFRHHHEVFLMREYRSSPGEVTHTVTPAPCQT
jgi:hypothetical protein